MKDQDTLYTGQLTYKEIEFTFVFDRKELRLIPPKDNKQEIEEQWLGTLVECFFQKIKWFRRIATRHDKLDLSFLAFIFMAAIMIWLL